MVQRIAILGLGDFGCELAKMLIRFRVEVIAVDKDVSRVQTITPHVNKAMVADITIRQALEEAGVDTVDVAVIAAAEPFEATVLAAHHLRELKVPLVIAKVANADQAKILSLIGVTQTINPQLESAVRSANLIAYPRVLDYLDLGDDHYVVRIEGIEAFAGQTVEDIRDKFKVDVILFRKSASLEGFKRALPDQTIAAGEEYILVGTRERLLDLRKVK